MRQVGDDMPDLSRTCDTLACRDGLSDCCYGYRSGSVIQRTVNAGDVPLLLMHPLEQGSDLIQCQGGRQAARQIHMDFIRTTRGIGAQFADPAQTIYPHPRQGIASEAAFGPAPIATQDRMVSWGLLARTVKASQSIVRVKPESMEPIELL
jgi:hypothetical protein